MRAVAEEVDAAAVVVDRGAVVEVVVDAVASAVGAEEDVDGRVVVVAGLVITGDVVVVVIVVVVVVVSTTVEVVVGSVVTGLVVVASAGITKASDDRGTPAIITPAPNAIVATPATNGHVRNEPDVAPFD